MKERARDDERFVDIDRLVSGHERPV